MMHWRVRYRLAVYRRLILRLVIGVGMPGVLGWHPLLCTGAHENALGDSLVDRRLTCLPDGAGTEHDLFVCDAHDRWTRLNPVLGGLQHHPL